MADKFLFVDSSPAGRASADKRLSDARSFVIRRVRAQQKATPKEWKFVHREDLKPATSCWGSPSEVQDEIREVPESASQSRHSGSTDALPLRSVSRTTLRLSAPEYGANSENGHAKTRKRKRGRCSCFTTQPEYGFSALCAECAATTAKALFRPSRSSIEGLLDPFDSVAVPLSARTKTLIAYFMNGIAPNLTPMVRGRNLDQLHRHWLAPSFRHPAFMHSILCLTALQYCIRNPDRPPYEFMYHRIQAVAAVQRNLSNPSEALREENIAAVFNLLCVEDNVALCDLYGVGKLQVDSEQRVVHLNGLKRMIKSKGGIRSLGKLKGLQSFLVRHTAVQAVASFEINYTLPKGLLQGLYDFPNSSLCRYAPAPTTAICRQHGLDKEFVEITWGVECLVHDLAEWYSDPTKYNWDVFDIQNLPCICIDRMLRWYLENLRTMRPIEGILIICFGICLAFICRGPDTVFGPLPIGVTRLQQHFEQKDVLLPFRGTGLDLWIAVICIVGTEFSGSEDFFFGIYTRVLEDAYPNLDSYEEFLTILQSWVWLAPSLDRFAVDVWSRTVRSLEAVGGGPESSTKTVTRFSIRRTSRIRISETETLRNPYVNAHPFVHLSVLGSAYEL